MATTIATADAIASHLEAAIDMLENAIRACPEGLWGDTTRQPQVWYLAYHTLFFLDFYLSGEGEGYRPPAPFTLAELDPSGVMPERVYRQDELLRFLARGRDRVRTTIAGLTPESAARVHRFGWGAWTMLDLLLMQLRHVQHHTAQIHLILREQGHTPPRWVGPSR